MFVRDSCTSQLGFYNYDALSSKHFHPNQYSQYYPAHQRGNWHQMNESYTNATSPGSVPITESYPHYYQHYTQQQPLYEQDQRTEMYYGSHTYACANDAHHYNYPRHDQTPNDGHHQVQHYVNGPAAVANVSPATMTATEFSENRYSAEECQDSVKRATDTKGKCQLIADNETDSDSSSALRELLTKKCKVTWEHFYQQKEAAAKSVAGSPCVDQQEHSIRNAERFGPLTNLTVQSGSSQEVKNDLDPHRCNSSEMSQQISGISTPPLSPGDKMTAPNANPSFVVPVPECNTSTGSSPASYHIACWNQNGTHKCQSLFYIVIVNTIIVDVHICDRHHVTASID